MPSPTAPAAVPAQAQQGGMSPVMKSLIQGIAIFAAMQYGMSLLGLKGPPKTTTTTDASGAVVNVPANTGIIPPFSARPETLDEGAVYSSIPHRIAPIWPDNSKLDIIVYVSPSFVANPLSTVPTSSLLIEEKDFGFGNWSENRVIEKTFPLPKQVQNNGTLWAHFHVGLAGSNLDPSVPGFDTAKAYHFIRPLTQYIHKKKVKKTKNLLAASNVTEEEEVEPEPKGPILANYYHPNFTMSFIPDAGTMNFPSTHPAVRQFIQLEATAARDGSGQNGWYYPLLFVNTFWQLRSDMTELNSTVKELPIRIDLNNQANWKFSLIASIDEGAKNNARQAASGGPVPAGGDGSEFEMLKEILIGTNVYLLATTGIVSVLHMIFEMLAFKSDISHWRNKKDNVGISVRSILANVVMQAIIFLYLLDNNENTSWMIVFGSGMGVLLEFWKITKTVDVRIRPAPNSLIPYRIVFEDKHELSETEKKTKEYDEEAFKYLYIIMVPLMIAYAAYSVIYDTHKSWYSFVITTLTGACHAYGFGLMVPSLWINYKLKSVAHMPAKAMTYKFLNTFIDDLFAFTIKMPTLHRLATLRDDVIFFVYLYQSWKYKVDYTRVNEFGQGGDEEELEAKLAAKPHTSPAGADAKEETREVEGVVMTSGSKAKKGAAVKRK